MTKINIHGIKEIKIVKSKLYSDGRPSWTTDVIATDEKGNETTLTMFSKERIKISSKTRK